MESQLAECMAKISRVEDVLLQISSNMLEVRKFTTDFDPQIQAIKQDIYSLKANLADMTSTLDGVQTNLYTLSDKVEQLLNSNS